MPNLIFIKVLAVAGLFVILSTFTNPTPALASHKVFQDNFDDGNANGWIVTRNPCIYNGLPAEWQVVNGELGIKINGGGCVTEIMPNDVLWNSLGDNYSIEFDTHLVSGTDHNFAFRYTDPDHWYDYHIQSPGALIMQRMLAPEGGSNVILGDFSNGQTIHFNIVVDVDRVKLYRGTNPQILLYDNPHMGGFFPTGRIALQASAGADPSSETYFDNIVVTNIDDGGATLPVPYYTQNSSPWGTTEYDHATTLGFTNTTMNRWGCAVTSAAMVLNYHSMTQFQDNSPLNPGSLNQWLKTHNGYLTGGSGNGSYSYLTWPAISKLTKDLYIAGKSNIELMHKRAYPSANTTTLLNDDLNVKNFPDILYVQNAQTSGHFVVAKGQVDSTYAINDPEWNFPDLSSFNNSYMQVDRYIPSNTNLNYIVVVVNPEVEILLIDPNGKKTGKQVVNGQIQEFKLIPNATYAFEAPISNPNENNDMESLGTGVNALLLPEPTDGKYQLLASTQTNEGYTINIALFDLDGNISHFKPVGYVVPNQDDFFDINYSQADNSNAINIVTFHRTIEDIEEAQNNNQITRDSLASNLIRIIKKAEDNVLDGRLVLAQRRLEHFERTINRNKGDEITEEVYQILKNDVDYLIAHL